MMYDVRRILLDSCKNNELTNWPKALKRCSVVEMGGLNENCSNHAL